MSNLAARSRETRFSLLAGGITASLILIAGAVFGLVQKNEFTAESVIVVLPSGDLDVSVSAAYYETLSRGQIVATFAEVANNLRFEQQAEEKLLLTAEQRMSVTTTVSVVPDTSVILVRASAEDATLAEQIADGSTSLATEYLGSLSKPYRTELVQGAQDSAYRSSTSPVLLVTLAAVVALIAGLAVQQALYHLLTAVRWGRKNRGAPDGGPADIATAVKATYPTPEKFSKTLL